MGWIYAFISGHIVKSDHWVEKVLTVIIWGGWNGSNFLYFFGEKKIILGNFMQCGILL